MKSVFLEKCNGEKREVTGNELSLLQHSHVKIKILKVKKWNEN
jgi:hypothetical protein